MDNQPETLVAFIIILDHSQETFIEGTDKVYEDDELALSLTFQFIRLGYDYQVLINYLVFALMSLRHSKNKLDRLLVRSKSMNINLIGKK